MDLITYLETRIEALDVLIKIHCRGTGDWMVDERAVCLIQLDKIKQRQREETKTNPTSQD